MAPRGPSNPSWPLPHQARLGWSVCAPGSTLIADSELGGCVAGPQLHAHRSAVLVPCQSYGHL